MTVSDQHDDKGKAAAVLRFLRGRWLLIGAIVMGLGAVYLIIAIKGCEQEPDLSRARKSPPAAGPPTVVTLKPDMVVHAGIHTAPVAKGEFRLHRDFPATVQPNENELAEVTTLIRGRVMEIYADFGQDVEKETLLALLHSTDLGQAEAAYLKAGAKLHEAELAYERARHLHEQLVISLAELLRREAAMRTARAELREATNRLKLLGVPAEEIQRLDREQTVRSEVPIRAPIAGRVIMRNLTRGEVVEMAQKIFSVVDLSDVWVVGEVPEKDVRFIHREQSVEVRATAYPGKVFPGLITYIGDVLDPATRTMRLRVTVPNPKKLLKPEMFATVRVYAAPMPDVLTVPLAAVQSGPAGPMVFVQRRPQEFEARAVTLGEESGEVVSVRDGLHEGDAVVVKGAFVLKSELDKQKIEPAR
jgi:cobalt-zinc-cadmium efflux system membrane fusion protein